jgi:tetratricopeptide repeat protein
MKYMNTRCIIVLLLIILLSGCGKTTPNPILERLDKMAKVNSRVELDSLYSISKDGLSKDDKMYYDFLSVKLADKAIINHTSDSIILSVIDYYSAHGSKERYAEALYYGGRVYHDIGDFPSAIKYYGEALSSLGQNDKSLLLKSKIAAQMAGLFNSMRLFNEARRYIDMSIEINSELKDTIRLMYDLEVLGANYIKVKDYDDAENTFRRAIRIADRKAPLEAMMDSVYLASIKNYKMEHDSAVLIIRGIPWRVGTVLNDDQKQFVYSNASDIYRCEGMPDSAYKYALELVKIKDAKNLKKGYLILLSEELKDLVPDDSIRTYVNHYTAAVESYMNTRGDANALIQNTQYNYSIVERDKQKALEKKRNVERWLALSVVILLLAIIVVIYYRDKSNRTLIKLRSALDSSRELRKQLETGDAKAKASEPLAAAEVTAEDLRRQLIDELTAVCDSKKKRLPLSPEIRNSRAYEELQEHIVEKRMIPDGSPLWGELHSVIIEASPNFDRRLQLLSQNKIKTDAYRIMLLIKCGVTPTQLVILVGRTKGALSNRRRILGLKFTDSEISAAMFDNLVYAL